MSQNISNTENIIGVNSTFEGIVKLNGTLRIDGAFYGKELSMQHIIIGKTGRVKSDINSESVLVEGTLLGNVIAKIRTMLLPTARVKGNISAPELMIQKGVLWHGHCIINPNDAEDIGQVIEKDFV